MNYFIGVDVGTGSARGALVSDKGNVLKVAVKDVKVWNDGTGFYEQSSENVWNACVECIKNVTTNINPEEIKGIGFDATCSLVALNQYGNPETISLSDDNERNIIMWLDHRAHNEAEEISSTNHEVLKFVGGKVSLEMQMPKLLWLKRNLKTHWNKYSLFFDLPDFLTWKATNCDSRSLCSLICKWNYQIQEDKTAKWCSSYFEEIGLDDLLSNEAAKIGRKVNTPGSPVGNGLSKEAALELGLLPGTPVGTSLIDAHSGGLGLIGCSAKGVDSDFSTRLALICGTSSCHMAVSNDPVFITGIWGPYFSAMVPGMWLSEGGQSVSGKLVDHIIDSHPASKIIKEKLKDTQMHMQEYLTKLLMEIKEREKETCIDVLTKDLHVWPDFHGNRSPIADPTLKGIISGLTISTSEESLALLYLATIQALAYGTRHIIESLERCGSPKKKSILICGGLSKNPVFIQTQSDVVNLPVVCPQESESVLLGSAILGACAANHFADMKTAIISMGGAGFVVNPKPEVQEYHKKKYKVFMEMVKNQLDYKKIME